MVAVAISYLALPNAQADVADLAAKYPGRFQQMAYDLGVDATAGAGAVAEVASIIDRVQTTGSVVTLVLCASLAFVLVAAATRVLHLRRCCYGSRINHRSCRDAA